jgi:hypothetical protein
LSPDTSKKTVFNIGYIIQTINAAGKPVAFLSLGENNGCHFLPAMAGPAPASSNGALSAACHGRKPTGPAVRGAPALRSHRPSLCRAHRRKSARAAMKSTSAQGRDSAPLFWIHRRETAHRFMLAVRFVMTATARSRIIMVDVVESLLSPPDVFASVGKSRLPSSFSHNFPFPFFSLALAKIRFNS